MPAELEARRTQAQAELADRLPAKPWSELVKTVPPGTLDGFGGPLYPKWQVAGALVRGRYAVLPGIQPPPMDRIRIRSRCASAFAR